jgi:N-acetylgalactosamine 4-sulfate 6-O-sulfotransferase
VSTFWTAIKRMALTKCSADTSYKVCTKDKIVNEGNRKKEHEAMREDTRKLLQDFYRPWNQKLAKLLNDDAFLWPD